MPSTNATNATNAFSSTTTSESNRIMHQLEGGPDISLDGDSVVFNPNNIDEDIHGNINIKENLHSLIFKFS